MGVRGKVRPARPGDLTGRDRVVVVVVLGLFVLGGLLLWVTGGYEGPAGGGTTLPCHAHVDWNLDDAGRRAAARFEAGCAEAKADRRRTALLIGAAVVAGLAVLGTWPSRRLTDDPGVDYGAEAEPKAR
jgi:hypothetical protein